MREHEDRNTLNFHVRVAFFEHNRRNYYAHPDYLDIHPTGCCVLISGNKKDLLSMLRKIGTLAIPGSRGCRSVIIHPTSFATSHKLWLNITYDEVCESELHSFFEFPITSPSIKKPTSFGRRKNRTGYIVIKSTVDLVRFVEVYKSTNEHTSRSQDMILSFSTGNKFSIFESNINLL